MHHNLMVREELSTTTGISMKVNLQRDKGVALEPTGSTKFISTLVNGNIIAFGVKAKFLEMMKCFLKVISKKA